jgi:hypothetical protein
VSGSSLYRQNLSGTLIENTIIIVLQIADFYPHRLLRSSSFGGQALPLCRSGRGDEIIRDDRPSASSRNHLRNASSLCLQIFSLVRIMIPGTMLEVVPMRTVRWQDFAGRA